MKFPKYVNQVSIADKVKSLSKVKTRLVLFLAIQTTLFLPQIVLGAEDFHERHHHIEIEIAKDKEGFVNTQFADKAHIDWGSSTASDGFKIGYLMLTPKNFDKNNGKTLVMIHGFSKDGTYWLDFTKAINAIEMGYQVLLPDLMVRGRTLDLNFPLDSDGNWKPTPEQKDILSNITASKEASYLQELLRNLSRSQNNFAGGIGYITHSRGNLVGAKLMTMQGRENLEAHQKGEAPKWNIFSYWNLNGFVSYTTASFLSLKNVVFDPKKISKVNAMNLTERQTYNYIMSALELLNLEYEIQLLRNQNVDEYKSQEQLQSMLEASKKLEAKLGAIRQSFLPFMEGVAESSFVDYVMKGIESALKEVYSSGENISGRKKREEFSMKAMMEGLRHIVKVSVDESGRQKMISNMQMYPESVIGDFIKFNHDGYPGLPRTIYSIMGKYDTIVPAQLSQHIHLATGIKGRYSSQVIAKTMELTHYSPEEEALRDLVKKTLAKYSPVPLEKLMITPENYSKKTKPVKASTQRDSFLPKDSLSSSVQTQCLKFYGPKSLSR